VVLAVVGALALAAPAAHAHAELTSATPAEHAVLATPPTTVRLTFTEDLMPGFAKVTLAVAGDTPKALGVKIDGRTLTASVPTRASAGRWVTAYRVVSVDGHTVTGTIPFTVRTTSTTPSTPRSTATSPAAPSPSLPTTGSTPAAAPPAGSGDEAPLGAPVSGPVTASSVSKGLGTAPSDLGWWVASAMFLVAAAAVAQLGQRGS
jgi:methionine-rich copper-binding protein CopC